MARGVDEEWVRNLYGFAIRPDGAFYFQVPVDVSLSRIAFSRAPGFYEAGMDLGLSTDPHESFQLFQTRIISEYDKMVDEFGLHIMPATKPIHEQQLIFRKIAGEVLGL